MCVPLDVHINAKVKRAYQAIDLVPERECMEETTTRRSGQVFEKEEL